MSKVDGNVGLESARIILAIKPHFADAILDGTKTIELRRRTAISPGSKVYLYATAPIQAIVGEFECRFAHLDSVKNLLEQFKEAAAIKTEQAHAYFSGCDEGVALGIGNARRWSKPLLLSTLQRACPTFRPPRSSLQLGPEHPVFARLAEHLTCAAS